MRKSKTAAVLLSALLFLGGCAAQSVPDSVPAAVPLPSLESVPTPEPTPKPTSEPTPEPTPEPTLEERLLTKMSTEEKVAQLFFVRCPETDVDEMIETLQPGGLLLFGRDIQNRTGEAITGALNSYQKRAKIPLLIGVDEEGGTVVRVSSNADLRESRFPSPRELYAQGGTEKLLETEKEKCTLLKSLGINVNFAPVCDISDDPDGFMYARSLGLPAEDTADVIAQTAALYAAEQTGCVLKHFPGYGNADDTHVGIVYDDRLLDVFRAEDFLPFRAGIQAGAGCVMVAHNIVTCVDAEKPASLSPVWYDILRNELEFSGVIITDDLQMDAITQYTEAANAAVDAVLAGCDMLCSSAFEVQYTAVLEAVKAGDIAEERIDESVLRILRWKHALGLV